MERVRLLGRLFLAAAVFAAALAVSWQGPTASASPATATGASSRISSADSLERPLLALVNRLRRDAGLGTLRLSPALARAADAHGRAMGRHGFFGHDSLDGSSVRDRVSRWLRSLRSGGIVGEVLLWRSPAPTPQEALSMWLHSPPHRAVLLDPRYRTIGLAAVTVRSAPGVYRGLDVTIVAADLAG